MKDWSYDSAKDIHIPEVERWRSTRREKGVLSALANECASAGLTAFFRVWHRLEVVGGEHLPKGPPFVLSANHVSHVDALVLAAALPAPVRGCVYPVAAGDVFFTTIASSVLSGLFVNALPLWRKKVTTHALAELRERVLAGHTGLILFPEGTRAREGKLGVFKPGLGMVVAGTDVPVVPCFLEGAWRALPPGKAVPRPFKIRVRVGPALRFGGVAQGREGWDEVSRRVREAVVGLGGEDASGPAR